MKMGSERNPEYKDVSNISKNNHLPIRMPFCVDGFKEKSKVQRRLTHNKNQVPNIMQLCVDGFEEKSRLQGRLKFTKTHLHKMMRLRVDGFGMKSTCVFGDTNFVVRRNQISCFGETDLCFIGGWPSKNCLHRASQREPLQSQHLKHSSGSFNICFTCFSAVYFLR